MKDWPGVVSHLHKVVDDVADRIHLRRSGEAALGSNQHIELARWDTPENLQKIIDHFQRGDFPYFGPKPDAHLLGFATGVPVVAPPAGARASALVEPAAPGEPPGAPSAGAPPPPSPALLVAVSRLAAEVEAARIADFALRLKVSAAKATHVLGAKPKSPRATKDLQQQDSRVDLTARIEEFKKALIATLHRAMDVNGVASRSGDHLISTLAEVQPRRDSWRSDYSNAHVPDTFMRELAVAIEVGAQDFVGVLLDHLEVFWSTEIVPELSDDEAARLHAAKLEARGLRADFDQELQRLRKAIHKAGDDFALRMQSGGVSAPILSIPKPFGPLAILGTAVRYPMQFAALATFILLPAAVAMGIALEANSGPALLRGLIIFVLPALLVLAFYQARLTRRVAIDAALDNARRHIHAEKAKTAREISDAISTAVSTFIDSLSARLTRDAIDAAESEHNRQRKHDDNGRELARTATANRVKGLDQLQDDLAKAIGAAKGQIRKLLEAELANKTRSETKTKNQERRAAGMADRAVTRKERLEEGIKKRIERRAGTQGSDKSSAKNGEAK